VKTELSTPLEALAAVLTYPGDGYRRHVDGCAAVLAGFSAEAAGEMAAFAEEVADLQREELEELYTRTFDLDPASCLDLGWHLYGEAYERGRFLVRIRGLLREHGVRENGELPDHLTNVLPLLGHMDLQPASELAREAVLPALRAMREALEKADNPYCHVLAAARSLVTERWMEPAAEVCHE